jgi:beta-glucosidase-like glycosyl hydrolase
VTPGDADRRLLLADFAGDPSIAAFSYADGPSGIRGAAGATAFPTTIALAASADRELAAEYQASTSPVTHARDASGKASGRTHFLPVNSRAPLCPPFTPRGR